MADTSVDFWAEVVRQLIANDPTWGIRYQQAADKRPFLDEMVMQAGGTAINSTLEAVSDLVTDLIS